MRGSSRLLKAVETESTREAGTFNVHVSSVRVRAPPTYLGAVAGVLDGVDNTQLVEHFTHDDDAHPDGRQTGSHGPEGAVGRGQRPQHHQDQVHQGRLHTATSVTPAEL